MKKFILPTIMLLLCFHCASPGAEISEKIVYKQSGTDFLLTKNFQPDEMAHFDELLMIKNRKKIAVFASEGRSIETVLFPDLDNDNTPEILVVMDLGGSGGYKELALLKNDGQSYKQVWDHSGFAGAKIKITNNKKTGHRQILINYLSKMADGKEKPKTAEFFWGGNRLQKRTD